VVITLTGKFMLSEAKRCGSDKKLEVHHRNRENGNSLENAEVLCHDCHVQTSTYGQEGDSPPSFTEETKKDALKRAGGRCECTRTSCNHGKTTSK